MHTQNGQFIKCEHGDRGCEVSVIWRFCPFSASVFWFKFSWKKFWLRLCRIPSQWATNFKM